MRFHLAIRGSFLEDSTAYSAFPGPFLEDSTLFRFSTFLGMFLEDITSYSSFPGPFLEVILSPIHLFLCFPSLPRCPDGKDLSLYFCIDLPSIILAQPSFTNFRVLPSKDYIQTHQSKLLQRTPTVHTRVHKTYKIRSLQRLGHLVDSIKPELLCQYTVSLTAFLCCHFHPPPVLFSSVAPIYFCSFKLF